MLRVFVIVVVCGGMLAGTAGALLGSGSTNLPFLLSLITLGVVSERCKVSLFGGSHVSVSVAACMAAFIAGGMRDAVVVAAVLGIAVNVGGAVAWYKTAFNASAYVLSTLAFAGTASICSLAVSAEWVALVAALTIGVVVDFGVNALIVGMAISLADTRPLRGVLSEKFGWLLPYQFPIGGLTAALVVSYDLSGVWAVPLIGIGLLSLQFAIAQYTQLRQRYDRDVSDVCERLAFVQAELRRMNSRSQAA